MVYNRLKENKRTIIVMILLFVGLLVFKKAVMTGMVISDNDLVLHYSFDVLEDGKVPDISPNNDYYGIVMPGTTFVDDESQCISGKCLHFDGTTGKGVYNENLDYDSSVFSIAAWVKYEDWGCKKKPDGTCEIRSGTEIPLPTTRASISLYPENFVPIIELDHEWGGNKFRFFAQNLQDQKALCHSVKVVSDSKWHQIVGVRKGELCKLYVDGEFACEFSISNVDKPLTRLFIGGLRGVSYPMNGYIDDVRLYSKELSREEVQSIYAGNVVDSNGIVFRRILNTNVFKKV